MASQIQGVPIQELPASTPPPGVRPNFSNPPSYEHTLIILEAIFVPLMLLVVFLRMFVRARITKSCGWDDYTCAVAACGSVAHMISYTQMFAVGFGRHLWDIRAITFLKVSNSRVLTSNGVVYAVTIFFAKLSILLLYLRIFNVDHSLRLSIHCGILFQALYYTIIVGLAIGAIAKCNGLSQLTNQFCVNYGKPVVVLNATVNLITDFYVLLLPIPRVLKLQLGRKHRIGLLIVFATGGLTCAVSLVRLVNFCIHYGDPDILWVQGRNSQYTIVEINVAIIVSCVTCFPAFFGKTRVFGGSFLSSLWSRIVTVTRGPAVTGDSITVQGSTTIKKTLMNSDERYEEMPKLRDDSYLELRDASEFANVGAASTAKNGNTVGA